MTQPLFRRLCCHGTRSYHQQFTSASTYTPKSCCVWTRSLFQKNQGTNFFPFLLLPFFPMRVCSFTVPLHFLFVIFSKRRVWKHCMTRTVQCFPLVYFRFGDQNHKSLSSILMRLHGKASGCSETPMENTSTSSNTRMAEGNNPLSNSASDPLLKCRSCSCWKTRGSAREQKRARRGTGRFGPAGTAGCRTRRARCRSRAATPRPLSGNAPLVRVAPPVCAGSACLRAGTASRLPPRLKAFHGHPSGPSGRPAWSSRPPLRPPSELAAV